MKLLLEEDDVETRAAAVGHATCRPCFDVAGRPRRRAEGQAPCLQPRPRPGRGEYLVIYDAEDRPERDQLRKSVMAFAAGRRPTSSACRPSSTTSTAPTTCSPGGSPPSTRSGSTSSCPGLQAIDVVDPAGRHVEPLRHRSAARARRVEPLQRHRGRRPRVCASSCAAGRPAILDTTTYEEATSRYRNWIRQRSRWVKGYMQTYLVHMRQPGRAGAGDGRQVVRRLPAVLRGRHPLPAAQPAVLAAHRAVVRDAAPPDPGHLPVRRSSTWAPLGLFVGNAACVLSVVSGCFARAELRGREVGVAVARSTGS